ncbi:MAG TPA: PEGA domain-containing protein [Terriglobia bacterium]|nr:PEGA domain-containing protein [Terriglobia bacterium]
MRTRYLFIALLLAIIAFSVSLFPVSMSAQAQSPATNDTASKTGFALEDGTPVKLRLTRTISSANAQVGDRVDFEVLDAVTVKGIVVVPKGSIAWGTVTEAHKKRRMGRGGKLNVNIDTVRLSDGEKDALRAVKDTQGGGHVGAMTGAIVATSIVFFPAAPLFLFMHGKDITIPKGTEIAAYTNGDMALDPAKFMPHTPEMSASAAVPQTCAVVVKSDPEGADIVVDGKYSGSTPSTLRVAAGSHLVDVSKPGFTKWERTISIDAGGDITVDATLQESQQRTP